ncbi:AraC family transcriptional regulator [Anaerocolumna xylanovorans]|uniref:AraC-type DNA-binding protein n=1 Tax=Anaerocolumna xylanovorans DSM 12503 TaxID=1121345 RepID=A0A1M7Y6U5_9FIRM|nr:AraC family transcriptional regulator [Anaerocolumna xylanovorans]SHO48385.1 AraC-type DNA-binding protein [Anaerocolumna xylanovorans DSM 12503]
MNNLKDVFLHIHYCNSRKFKEPGQFNAKMARTLNHHELIFICNGKGSFKIRNKQYSIKKGMLLIISPDVPYSIELDSTVPAGVLTIHFSFAGITFNDGKWNVNDNMQAPLGQPVQEIKEYYHIEEQFQKLVDCWNEKLPGYEFSARTMFQQLIIEIMQSRNKQSQSYGTSLKVEKIIQYMHQNINARITLPELSKLVHMTPAYMSRTFKDTTGYTIIEYFNKLKIDKSKELLIEGNKKVKEVAQELGFADEFYFSRMFKKSEGITPSQFNSRIVHGI